jgi:hypothetical protein
MPSVLCDIEPELKVNDTAFFSAWATVEEDARSASDVQRLTVPYVLQDIPS